MWIALPVLIALWLALHVILRQPPEGGCQLIAHRGAAGLAPENTLEAVREGIRQGASIIEVDIRRSADGRLVVMHDQTVDRTTNGHGDIGRLAWPDIAALDAGGKFSAEFAGAQVPLLDDVLQELSGHNVRLLIEVKAPEKCPGIEAQLRQVLANIGAILDVAGSGLDRVLQMTVYISDLELWSRFNAVYAEVMGNHRPARAVVPVGSLHYGYQVEVQAVAALRE